MRVKFLTFYLKGCMAKLSPKTAAYPDLLWAPSLKRGSLCQLQFVAVDRVVRIVMGGKMNYQAVYPTEN